MAQLEHVCVSEEMVDNVENWSTLDGDSQLAEERPTGRKRKRVDKAAQAEKKKLQLEFERQNAFKKLQKLLKCSKKYSSFLVKELERLQKTPEERKSVLELSAEGNTESKCMVDSSTSSTTSREETVTTKRQPSLLTGGQMRPYQLDGFEWLRLMYENGVSCILADEMGLGKTIQTIAFFAHLIENGITGPFLVCAPLSTLPNWIFEFKRFAPDIPVLLFHGDATMRKMLKLDIMKMHTFGKFRSYPVVITTYNLPLIDKQLLSKYRWRTLVIDEGHRIKNVRSVLRAVLFKYPLEHKILLTGTPMQNNLIELWSLLNFLIPEIFNDIGIFEAWFDITSLIEKDADKDVIAQEQERHIVGTMHEVLAPFLLRRTKTEVEISLPMKKEIVVYTPKSAKQDAFIDATLNKTIEFIIGSKAEVIKEEEALTPSGRIKRKCNCKNKIKLPKKFEISLTLQSVFLHMRKICNHPYLVENPLDDETQYHKITEKIVTDCGKMQVLDCLLKGLKSRGHKVLLFSVWVRMLDIIHDYCDLRGFVVCRLQGDTTLEDRCQQIAEFNGNPETFIFLISTRAGGLGINLTAADTVILYDSDWNPQVDLQAQDRCHRIGQTKPIVVYRLITANSVEEHIIERATAKRKLEKIILKNGRFSGPVFNKKLKDMTVEELKELLMATDKQQTVKTCNVATLTESELDFLLDRSDME